MFYAIRQNATLHLAAMLEKDAVIVLEMDMMWDVELMINYKYCLHGDRCSFASLCMNKFFRHWIICP